MPPCKHVSPSKQIFKLRASITYPTAPTTFDMALIIEDPVLYNGDTMGMTGDWFMGSMMADY